MKRLLSLVVILSFLSVCLPEAQAWSWGKKQGEKEKTVETKEKKSAPGKVKSKEEEKNQAEELQKKTQKSEEEARKVKRALIEQKRKEMDNMEWEIQLNPLSGKGKVLPETVIFRNSQVSFIEFGKKGFTPSNFSLKVQEDKILVWETMQSQEKSGVVFWRGEISPDLEKMRGVASYQMSDKKKDDYSFVSTKKRALTQ